jgi:hypothetical protein
VLKYREVYETYSKKGQGAVESGRIPGIKLVMLRAINSAHNAYLTQRGYSPIDFQIPEEWEEKYQLTLGKLEKQVETLETIHDAVDLAKAAVELLREATLPPPPDSSEQEEQDSEDQDSEGQSSKDQDSKDQDSKDQDSGGSSSEDDDDSEDDDSEDDTSEGEDSKDDTSEDDTSEGEDSKDDDSEDDSSEEDSSEGEDSEDDTSEGEDSKDDDSEDDTSEGEDSKDDTSEDDDSEDDTSEGEDSEDDNSEDENSEDDTSEEDDSEDQDSDSDQDSSDSSTNPSSNQDAPPETPQPVFSEDELEDAEAPDISEELMEGINQEAQQYYSRDPSAVTSWNNPLSSRGNTDWKTQGLPYFAGTQAKIRALLQDEKASRVIDSLTKGKRIDQRHLYRHSDYKVGKQPPIWKQRLQGQNIETAVFLSLDESGSMRYDRWFTICKVLSALTSILDSSRVKYTSVGWTGGGNNCGTISTGGLQLRRYNNWGVRLNPRDLPQLPIGNMTPSLEPVLLGLDELGARSEIRKILMYFTDGEPSYSEPLRSAAILAGKESLEKARASGIFTFGFGIDMESAGNTLFREWFKEGWVNLNSNLPPAGQASTIMKKLQEAFK